MCSPQLLVEKPFQSSVSASCAARYLALVVPMYFFTVNREMDVEKAALIAEKHIHVQGGEKRIRVQEAGERKQRPG